MRRMGARGLVSKALLDDDPEFFRDIEASARGVSSAVTGQAGSPSEPARPARSTGASSQAPAASAGATGSAAAGDTTAAGQKKTDGGADWGAMDEGDVL